MAATTGTTGFGTLLARGNGATSETFTTVAEVRSIRGPGQSLELVDATHMESPSGFREWLASFKDGGEVTFQVNFLPANATHTGLYTDHAAKTKRNFRITWPNTAGTKCTFAAFITGLSPSASVGEMLLNDVTLRITGAVTWS